MGFEHVNCIILSMEDRIMKSLTNILMMTSLFISLMFLNGCVSDAPFKFENTTIPEQLDDGWEIATPEEVNISQAALDEVYQDFVDKDHFLNAKSLLVVKNDKLVFETYCRDVADRDRYGHIMSVTKSINSLVFGIVKSEGLIDSLDQLLYDIIADKFPSDLEKRSITLRHLLTMRSGILFDNDQFSQEIHTNKPKDPIKYILNKPLYAAPGEEYYYRDCDPHLISYTIERLTGKTLAQNAQERLFEPLGITDYHWETDPAGTSTGAYGLFLRPRDLAKIGQMVLSHGQWKGVQIVDSSWVAISTQKQVETDYQTEPYIYHYGYYWWIVPGWQAFAAWGSGGTYIFIMPSKEMVVVMTSMPDVDSGLFEQTLPSFEELIRPLLE